MFKTCFISIGAEIWHLQSQIKTGDFLPEVSLHGMMERDHPCEVEELDLLLLSNYTVTLPMHSGLTLPLLPLVRTCPIQQNE